MIILPSCIKHPWRKPAGGSEEEDMSSKNVNGDISLIHIETLWELKQETTKS